MSVWGLVGFRVCKEGFLRLLWGLSLNGLLLAASDPNRLVGFAALCLTWLCRYLHRGHK